VETGGVTLLRHTCVTLLTADWSKFGLQPLT